jgi:amidophosphoribosyltransferase
LKDNEMMHILDEVLEKCKKSLEDKSSDVNYVKEIYAPFTYEELSQKITEIVRP